MSNHSIDVDIRVNGKTLRQYPHKNRLFVEAKHGSEYSVHVYNGDYRRVLVVVSVDGINVLNGQAGGKSRAGYVVNGYSPLEVKGFRTSNDNVNAFKFSSKGRSYAAKSDETGGDTSNCGVIGIQVYAEKEKPAPEVIKEYIPYPVSKPWISPPITPQPTWYPTWYSSCSTGGHGISSVMRCYTSNSAGLGSPGVVATASFQCSSVTNEDVSNNFDMGTEWSNHQITDKVHEVEFETGRQLTQFTIYYASREALLDMGVPLTNRIQVAFPEPFPSKFCKPPR